MRKRKEIQTMSRKIEKMAVQLNRHFLVIKIINSRDATHRVPTLFPNKFYF
nr:hypothetical protein [uncultured Fluviicola sp.]